MFSTLDAASRTLLGRLLWHADQQTSAAVDPAGDEHINKSSCWIIVEWTSDAAQLSELEEALHTDHGDVLVKWYRPGIDRTLRTRRDRQQTGIFDTLYLVPVHISSVLSMSSVIRLAVIHCSMTETHCCADCASSGWQWMWSWLSSAYAWNDMMCSLVRHILDEVPSPVAPSTRCRWFWRIHHSQPHSRSCPTDRTWTISDSSSNHRYQSTFAGVSGGGYDQHCQTRQWDSRDRVPTPVLDPRPAEGRWVACGIVGNGVVADCVATVYAQTETSDYLWTILGFRFRWIGLGLRLNRFAAFLSFELERMTVNLKNIVHQTPLELVYCHFSVSERLSRRHLPPL